MTKYKVETKHVKTGAWDGVLTVNPEYVVTVKTVYKCFFFFPRQVGVISNLREAELAAYMKAVRFAKAMYHACPCRIAKQVEENGAKSTDIVWQNGHAIADQHGWFRRLILLVWHG